MEEPAQIRTIFGGSSGGGDSNRARKAHSRKPNLEHYVHLTERPSKELRVNPCTLTFTEEDAHGIHHPHDDALVVTMTIANRKVYRILVDTESSADVMYSEAFERMRIPRSHLRPVKTPLHGFARERVISEGAISFPVTAGEGQHQITLMVDFLVVNVPSVHNVILGRPSLNAMRAAVSTYHPMMKFPTKDGIGHLRDDQREARRRYAMAVKKGSIKQSLTINILDPRGLVEGSSVEDLEKPSYDNTGMSSHGPTKMSKISPDVIAHRLNVDPDHRPVKQKRRSFDAERYEAIANEVSVLLDVGFIEEYIILTGLRMWSL
ncbi:uncharacterized protein LOC131226999 [Magnolia sinica]|uniref:uncharacterized protein LOC131226999 n=1 Tax=Magnolia sinica TaxID=86752 RepID=UPI00265B64C9|nr:uncharacterized protein LOC131226999 [Magnolia sinica]